jgi:hypothetical protein
VLLAELVELLVFELDVEFVYTDGLMALTLMANLDRVPTTPRPVRGFSMRM